MTELYRHTIKESVAHECRATTIVEPLGLYPEEDMALTDLVSQLNDLLESIPSDYRQSAKLHISESGYGSITWERPETDDEMAARIAWLKSLDIEREASERRQFVRLKEKYGS